MAVPKISGLNGDTAGVTTVFDVDIVASLRVVRSLFEQRFTILLYKNR